MKRIYLILTMMLTGMGVELLAQADAVPKEQSHGSIDVYYFHATRRCATCNAVEDESKAALLRLYPEQMESQAIVFHSVNFEEPEGEELAKKMDVPGQALLVVKGDAKKDLTSEGFMYARTAPEKLQNSLKKAIDPLL